MSDDVDKQARKWAEDVRDNFMHYDDEEISASQFILERTSPPTMADVDWDDEIHRLAGATSSLMGEEVIMLANRDGMIDCFSVDVMKPVSASRNALTPNGKRYELREVTLSSDENVGVDQLEHPETLTTVEDYQGAPVGTVVAAPTKSAWTKDRVDSWEHTVDDRGMAKLPDPRKVLRWGWGDEA